MDYAPYTTRYTLIYCIPTLHSYTHALIHSSTALMHSCTDHTGYYAQGGVYTVLTALYSLHCTRYTVQVTMRRVVPGFKELTEADDAASEQQYMAGVGDEGNDMEGGGMQVQCVVCRYSACESA
jgi:hypothetical protein